VPKPILRGKRLPDKALQLTAKGAVQLKFGTLLASGSVASALAVSAFGGS
jgi:hypothetical protein